MRALKDFFIEKSVWFYNQPRSAWIKRSYIRNNYVCKLREQLTISINQTNKDEIILMAKKLVASWLENNEIIKEIYVPGKIINFVIKPK